MSIVSVVLPSLRSALLACGLSAGALIAAPVATAATGDRSGSRPPASVSRGVCTTSLDDAEERSATFSVRMARGRGTTDYGFTATLQEKEPDGRWSTLSGEAAPDGLGSFQAAAAGAGTMVRKINVSGLRMGSAYRLKVSFRWTTPSGRQKLTRRSSACTVKDLRPNLEVSRSLGWIPGPSGGQVVYRTRLRVARAAELDDRTVTLSVRQGDAVLGSATVERLDRKMTVLVPGLRCRAGDELTIRIEAAPSVDERRTSDNELTAPCGSQPGSRR